MQTDLVGLLEHAADAIPAKNDRGGWRFCLRRLGEHLTEVRDRWKAGDTEAVLTEFFSIYHVDETEGTPK